MYWNSIVPQNEILTHAFQQHENRLAKTPVTPGMRLQSDPSASLNNVKRNSLLQRRNNVTASSLRWIQQFGKGGFQLMKIKRFPYVKFNKHFSCHNLFHIN